MEYSPFADPRAFEPLAPAMRSGGGNLSAILARTEEAVEEETRSIRTDLRFDLQASNARKSRCLYELTRAVKGLRAGDVSPEQQSGFARLRDKLALNERALKAHMDAVGEVASLLQTAIRQSQSDGTYGSGAFGWNEF